MVQLVRRTDQLVEEVEEIIVNEGVGMLSITEFVEMVENVFKLDYSSKVTSKTREFYFTEGKTVKTYQADPDNWSRLASYIEFDGYRLEGESYGWTLIDLSDKKKLSISTSEYDHKSYLDFEVTVP